jgi:segregation and condensation protein A
MHSTTPGWPSATAAGPGSAAGFPASGAAPRIPGMILEDLELDLDVFQGPFDLLLALILREEVELAEVPIAEIIAAYVERAYDRGALDLESASEFLVLMAALLEIKVRLLFPGEMVDEDEMTPEQAEAELMARLIEYRRFQGAGRWLRDRYESEPRIFRDTLAPLAPRPQPQVVDCSEDPWRLAQCIDRLLEPPPPIDVSSVRRPLVPVGKFLDHFRTILRERRAFQFEEAVKGLDRLSQAAAFLALLEMVKRGEAVGEQQDVFAPIRVAAAPPGRAVESSAEEKAIA